MFKSARHATLILALGFAVLACLLIGALVVSEGQTRDEGWVRHTLMVENQLSGLLASLQDAEAGQRTYLITGDEGYLTTFRAASVALPQEVETLADATKDNPRQLTAVTQL